MDTLEIDDATVSRFMSVTGCNLQHARFLLEASNGNFESARQMFYGRSQLPQLPQCVAFYLYNLLDYQSNRAQRACVKVASLHTDTMSSAPAAPRPAAPPAASMPTPPRPVAPAARQQAQQQHQQQDGLIQAAARLPFRLLWAGLGVVGSVFRLGFAAAAYVGDRVLPPSLMSVARGEAQPACRHMLSAAWRAAVGYVLSFAMP